MTGPVEVAVHRRGDPGEPNGVGARQWEAWSARELPPVERLPGGVWSVPLPMTEHAPGYVLCYIIESSSGPVLIDPGCTDEVGWNVLKNGLSQAGWRSSDVQGVLISHAHSDHVGMAARIREASGCWIGMHQRDAEVLVRYGDGSAAEHRNGAFLDLAGVPDEERRRVSSDAERLRRIAEARPDRTLRDGESALVPGRHLQAR